MFHLHMTIPFLAYSHLVNVPPDLIPCSTAFIHGYLGSVAVPRAPETV
jgi:hypothetical protein